MQLLYQHDFTQQPLDELFTTYWQNMREHIDDEVQRYANRLVVGTLEHLKEIDQSIAEHATHWRLSRMASVDRNVLRIAVYEMLYESETPRVVAIDEAIEVARRYSNYEATQFINGLLDAIRRDLESASPPKIRSTGTTG